MQATAVQSWGPTYTGSIRWYVRILPSLTDFAFLLPAFLAILAGTQTLLADGDTGWHIRTGEWILEHRAIPKVDLFSFTKTGQPWFAWEWGWDLLFGSIHKAWGLGAVALANLVLLCFVSALLYRLIRRCSGNDLLAMLFTVLAFFGSSIHWLARPHLLSWVFVLIFYHAILSAAEGRVRGLYWLPFLTVAWVNIHGSFFVGVLMVFLTAMAEAASVLCSERRSCLLAFANARPYLLCAGACIAASFVNPYTWHLHRHIFDYLRDSRLLDQIQEFQSISFHHWPTMFFECMLVMGLASTVWCLKRRNFAAASLIVLWAHFALLSARNIPIFLFIAAPWVCCMMQDAGRSLKPLSCVNHFCSAIEEVFTELQPVERIARWHVASLLVVVWMMYLLANGDTRLNVNFDAKKFPAQTIPVLESRRAGHVFTFDQWGDYLIYRLYPSTQVFVDGRSDFYGADFVLDCGHIVNARYDWNAQLSKFSVDAVLLKPDAPLATVLKQSPKWQVLFDDGHAIVFGARAAVAPAISAASQQNVRFSPVYKNGGNELGAMTGSQVLNCNLRPITHERRS